MITSNNTNNNNNSIPQSSTLQSAFSSFQDNLFKGANAYGQFKNYLNGNMDMFSRESAFNSAEAEKARRFELEMSNTAYQRSIADIKKAGLNPALIYANGNNSASTPSGSTARATGKTGGIDPNTEFASKLLSAVKLISLFKLLHQ